MDQSCIQETGSSRSSWRLRDAGDAQDQWCTYARIECRNEKVTLGSKRGHFGEPGNFLPFCWDPPQTMGTSPFLLQGRSRFRFAKASHVVPGLRDQHTTTEDAMKCQAPKGIPPLVWAKFLQKKCSKNLVEFLAQKMKPCVFWLKFLGSPIFCEIVCHRTPNRGKTHRESNPKKCHILKNPGILREKIVQTSLVVCCEFYRR